MYWSQNHQNKGVGGNWCCWLVRCGNLTASWKPFFQMFMQLLSCTWGQAVSHLSQVRKTLEGSWSEWSHSRVLCNAMATFLANLAKNPRDGLKNRVALLFGAVPLRFLTLFASDLPQRTVHRIWAWSLSSDGPAFQETNCTTIIRTDS